MHVPEKCRPDFVVIVGRDNSYRTLKVGICRKCEDREVRVLNYLKELKSSHNGRYCVRRPEDSFEIKVPDGYHYCLVYDPLGQSLLENDKRQRDMTLNINTVRWIATYVLTAVDYLHTCGVVHTGKHFINHWRFDSARCIRSDIKLDNIQSTLPDEESIILASFVGAERSQPSFRKRIDDQLTIYTSRPFDASDVFHYPILGDFGSAVFNKAHYEGLIQPIPYRAPEVILRMNRTSSVDIWNIGVMVRDSSSHTRSRRLCKSLTC